MSSLATTAATAALKPSDIALYNETTDQLEDTNEIFNVNSQLYNINLLEFNKITNVNNTLQNQLAVGKEKFLLQQYGANEYGVRNTILLSTICVSAILFCIVSLFMMNIVPKNVVMYATAILAVLFILIVYFVARANANRRKYDWNAYIFDGMQK